MLKRDTKAAGQPAVGEYMIADAKKRQLVAWRFLCLLVLFVITNPSQAATPYQLGAGDLIAVTVYDEADMSLKKVQVGTEGKISMPLLGEITVAGLSVGELESRVTDLLLNGYLKKPKVTVSILEYRLFYVTGQVKKPGAYNYIVDLTVRKAIAIAGGLTIRGSDDKLKVIPENQAGVENQVSMESHMGPGDILNVGETFF